MQGPEKNSYKEFDNEKKFLRLENSPPPPPHNFSNGLSLKDRLPATLPVINNLINSSFASNCFAHAWKSAVVISNLKSGDPDEPENTRPISLLLV